MLSLAARELQSQNTRSANHAQRNFNSRSQAKDQVEKSLSFLQVNGRQDQTFPLQVKKLVIVTKNEPEMACTGFAITNNILPKIINTFKPPVAPVPTTRKARVPK